MSAQGALDTADAPLERKSVTLRWLPRHASWKSEEAWAEEKMRLDDTPEALEKRVYEITGFPTQRPLKYTCEDEDGDIVTISRNTMFAKKVAVGDLAPERVMVMWVPAAAPPPRSTAAAPLASSQSPFDMEGADDAGTDMRVMSAGKSEGDRNEFRKGVMRAKDPTRSTVGDNPQLSKVQTAVARPVWLSMAKKAAPTEGKSAAASLTTVRALHFQLTRTPVPHARAIGAGILPWGQQDSAYLFAEVRRALSTDLRTQDLAAPDDATLQYVMSKAIGAASRRDGTARGRPAGKRKNRGAYACTLHPLCMSIRASRALSKQWRSRRSSLVSGYTGAGRGARQHSARSARRWPRGALCLCMRVGVDRLCRVCSHAPRAPPAAIGVAAVQAPPASWRGYQRRERSRRPRWGEQPAFPVGANGCGKGEGGGAGGRQSEGTRRSHAERVRSRAR
jgi:hypothetical protein